MHLYVFFLGFSITNVGHKIMTHKHNEM